jgi:7-cyano-7-deazaguanine synthase in queuosine biosynthesis
LGRESSLDLGLAGKWIEPWKPDAAVLFSGGLDSLAGAIDLLEKGQRLLLVSHHDFGQLAGLQQNLAKVLGNHYGPGRLRHLGLRVQFPETRELSLRSRSLLYLSLGLAAAAGVGPDTPLIIPENGWISLNPPLTGNRLGSLSTRTTHPAILTEVTALWREAGLSTPLINPYQDLSKGEALSASANPGLLRQLAPQTLSCARPVVSRWRRQAAGHCGYCYPCLVRRAALNRLGWDDGTAYRVDVLQGQDFIRDRPKGQDLRAVLLALDTWERAPQELMDRLWLGDDPELISARLEWARAVLQAGFAELGSWFREQGGRGISEYWD